MFIDLSARYVGRFFFLPAMPFIASKLVQCQAASPHPFIYFSVPPFVNRNSEHPTLSCPTDIFPFVTGCNSPIAVQAHAHIHMANDARRILSLTSLSYIDLIPHQQVSPCTIHQHRYALHHYPYFWSHHYTFPTYLPADSQ